MSKIYIGTIVEYLADGQQIPLEIIWEDGRKFDVDKITDVKKAASLNVCGQGLRYTCRIHGKEIYLFLEDGRWFMEGK